MSTITGLATLVALITFIGIVWWAFSRGRAQANRDASMLPFDQPDETDLIDSEQGSKQQPSKKQQDQEDSQ